MENKIVLDTTPRDKRFPNTNQANHCWYFILYLLFGLGHCIMSGLSV